MRIVAMRAREETVETDFRIGRRNRKWRGEKSVRAQSWRSNFDEQGLDSLHACGGVGQSRVHDFPAGQVIKRALIVHKPPFFSPAPHSPDRP